MADQFDRATEIEERDREQALAMRKPEGPAATGFCLNCEEPLEDGRRWCDKDCSTDWQRRQPR